MAASVSSSRSVSAWLISPRFCRSATSSSLASAAAARSEEFTANLYSSSASWSCASASASRPRSTARAGLVVAGTPMTSSSLRRLADHDAGDRMHHANDGLLGFCARVCEDEFGLALGLLIHAPRHIEPGEVEPGLRTLIRLGRRNRQHQRVFAPDEPLRLIFLPLVDIENRPDRVRRALGGDARR